MSKYKREFDSNICDALNKLKWPLINNKGHKVFVREKARKESGFEHISNKSHLLKIRDIEQIPSIFVNPIKIVLEKNGRKGKSYFGLRKGNNKTKYIKIVVRVENDSAEEIVTIYTTNVIK